MFLWSKKNISGEKNALFGAIQNCLTDFYLSYVLSQIKAVFNVPCVSVFMLCIGTDKSEQTV